MSNSYANLSTGSPSPNRRRWIGAWGRTVVSPHAVPALAQDHSKGRGFCLSACPAAWPLNVVAAAGVGVLYEATAREEDEIRNHSTGMTLAHANTFALKHQPANSSHSSMFVQVPLEFQSRRNRQKVLLL
jgi:hypothetical protein